MGSTKVSPTTSYGNLPQAPILGGLKGMSRPHFAGRKDTHPHYAGKTLIRNAYCNREERNGLCSPPHFYSHCRPLPGWHEPQPQAFGCWVAGWQSGLRVRECVLCTYSYEGSRLADWLAPLRIRAYVRCSCRFTKAKRFSC